MPTFAHFVRPRAALTTCVRGKSWCSMAEHELAVAKRAIAVAAGRQPMMSKIIYYNFDNHDWAVPAHLPCALSRALHTSRAVAAPRLARIALSAAIYAAFWPTGIATEAIAMLSCKPEAFLQLLLECLQRSNRLHMQCIYLLNGLSM